MLSLLTQHLTIYVYADATPDAGVDNPTYTFATDAWGRIEPRAAPTDRTVAAAARFERTATITFRESVPVPDGCLVVDTANGDQWRVTGTRPLQMARMRQYTADWAPQFALTSTPLGP